MIPLRKKTVQILLADSFGMKPSSSQAYKNKQKKLSPQCGAFYTWHRYKKKRKKMEMTQILLPSCWWGTRLSAFVHHFFFFFLWHRAWEKYFKTAVQTRKLHTIRLSANWGMGGYSTKCIYTFSWLTTEFRITSLLEAMWILLPSFYLSDEKDIYSILSHQSHFYCSHMVYYRIVLSTSHCTRNSSMKIASEH